MIFEYQIHNLVHNHINQYPHNMYHQYKFILIDIHIHLNKLHQHIKLIALIYI